MFKGIKSFQVFKIILHNPQNLCFTFKKWYVSCILVVYPQKRGLLACESCRKLKWL